MSFGLFQEYGQTSKGGPKLKIAGKWVYPSRGCNLDGVAPGMQVEYETTNGGKDGDLLILQRIRAAPQSAHETAMQQNYNAAATGRTPVGSTITDGDILRSVSNVVGNAAAAGKIEHWSDIDAWVLAAYTALINMGKAQASGTDRPGSAPKEGEPPFDDDMPPWVRE